MSQSASPYIRPRLTWIKRRARRLQGFYGINRRMAIFDAWRDHIAFTGQSGHAGTPSTLVLIRGGRHG